MVTDKTSTPRQHDSFLPHFFDPFRDFGRAVSDFFAPKADASSGGENYRINLELPGVDRKDVDISLHENVLTIKGEKKAEETREEDGYYFSERSYGSFQRSFRLPADANTEGIEAAFRDGVLTVTVPKTPEQASNRRKIEIKR